jgi:hypothetical protein
LNYTTLKEKYKKYFGLLMSQLYSSSASPNLANLTPPTKFSTILRELRKDRKRQPELRLNPEQKFNLYNTGGKLTELLLKINTHRELEPG